MTTVMTTKWARHVVDLAAAFAIHINVIAEAANAGAGHVLADKFLPLDEQRKVIAIAPVTSEVTYAIAMHELGHLLHPCGQLTLTEASLRMRLTSHPTTLRDVKLQLDEEEAAWEWARSYALEWTPRMVEVEQCSHQNYCVIARRYGVRC